MWHWHGVNIYSKKKSTTATKSDKIRWIDINTHRHSLTHAKVSTHVLLILVISTVESIYFSAHLVKRSVHRNIWLEWFQEQQHQNTLPFCHSICVYFVWTQKYKTFYSICLPFTVISISLSLSPSPYLSIYLFRLLPNASDCETVNL